mgnify:CR=1 FL=1
MAESIMDKLQKVLALVERGEDGEQESAERLLNNLLEKYEMTIEDLRLEEQKVHRVWWDTKAESQLIIQIFGMLFGRKRTFNTNDCCIYRSNNAGADLNLTDLEWIEFESHYHHYRKIYRQELKDMRDNLIHAVCQKFSLFVMDDRTPEELAEEEMKSRMAHLARLEQMTEKEKEEYEALLLKERRAAAKQAEKVIGLTSGIEHKGLYKQLGEEQSN